MEGMIGSRGLLGGLVVDFSTQVWSTWVMSWLFMWRVDYLLSLGTPIVIYFMGEIGLVGDCKSFVDEIDNCLLSIISMSWLGS